MEVLSTLGILVTFPLTKWEVGTPHLKDPLSHQYQSAASLCLGNKYPLDQPLSQDTSFLPESTAGLCC